MLNSEKTFRQFCPSILWRIY